MQFRKLQQKVWRANRELAKTGLVVLTWGNISGVDRRAGVVAIKPSGVAYNKLRPEDIVVLSLEKGKIVAGDLRPSSDTPTHLFLYRKFKSLGGIVHTHSSFATAWAQARRPIPSLGTTHADYFMGPVPLTRSLTAAEIRKEYEQNTGKVIVEHFTKRGLNPEEFPGVLLPNHGVFAWGRDEWAALEAAIIIEEIAKIAFYTVYLNPHARIPLALQKKHYSRKHGASAYYGQR